MEIKAKSSDRNLLLEFRGDMDHHGARNALKELEMTVDAALPKTLVLDMGGVTFMDSSGIAVLLRTWRHMERLGGTMRVIHTPTQADKVFRAAGLQRLITFE